MQSRARIAMDIPSSRHSAENQHFQDLEFFNRIGHKQPLVLTRLVMNTRLSSSGSPASETQVYEPPNTCRFLDTKKPWPLNQTL